MSFRFSHFIVEDRSSTMKVGTDAMLLGSWVHPTGCRKILDVGTGCGVLALMMAQRSAAVIDAIDTDSRSIREAAENFAKSGWGERMHAYGISLQAYSLLSDTRYDLIVSNPPYFENSLKSSSERKKNTRHTTTLSYADLLTGVSALLNRNGRFAIVIPIHAAARILKIAGEMNLYPRRSLAVSPFPGKPPTRTLFILSGKNGSRMEEEKLAIWSAPNRFSPDYLKLTFDFHHF